MKACKPIWAAELPDAPRMGEDVTQSATGVRFRVIHVGRLVWLRSPVLGLEFVEGDRFWSLYDRKQLTLRLLPSVAPLALLALLAWCLAGCLTLAGIAVAPNGTVWLSGNVSWDGPAVYSCAPARGELHCTRVPLHGTPP
jgi:hypothetical protein